MGVTRENKDVFFSPYIQDDEMHVLESSGQSTDEEDTHAHLPTSSPRRHVLRGNRFRLRPRSASLEACLTGMYRRTGAKQARRTENIKYLLNLGDKDEEGEGTQTVTYNSNSSAFAELFCEREKMQAWNDFIKCSEEEQEQILAMGGRRHLASIQEESDESEGDENGNLDDSWEKVTAPEVDKRSEHPSYSAEECFQRIDKHLRSMLTRRHVPVGVLARLEEEVVNFFVDCPGSVYVSHLASSFERMLLHALCQFLRLQCRSYDEDGQRRTQVENKLPAFHPPSESLSQYLDRIS
ncbi:hypothetical protein BaRGS_00018362 [Batillaria attramentaria]|uniref:R3H domain-containing protein n=1 Tax=Batillaria attramentaria TaxID=370345 RepID=A0ABD0KTW0_9CAEN